MKKYFLILCTALCILFHTSCLEEYLDKSPESGLTADEVFSNLKNFKLFFNSVYYGYSSSFDYVTTAYNIKQAHPLYQDIWSPGTTWCELTDMSDEGMLEVAQKYKQGYMGGLSRTPILQSMFIVIRKCNMTLQNIHKLKDVEEGDKNDLIAQAMFIRAYAHFTLFRIWGPMPYITNTLDSDDDWDLPRLTGHETCQRIAADLDSAAIYYDKAGKMRRDPGPGENGHLNDPDQDKPNGVAALALRGRALLYAASPLSNELGVVDWENAAIANWQALSAALDHNYTLLQANDYKLNYVGTEYTNEQIWGYYAGTWVYSSTNLKSLLNSVFRGFISAAECPTQNFVDKFETIWGEPLSTPEERNAAALLGHYNEQNPYVNRDPRFAIDVIYNEAPIAGYGTAKIYYEYINGSIVNSELLNRTNQGTTYTGYYQRKRWGNQSIKNKIQPKNSDPLIRLAEVYLNYAEAANEAYGPNTPAPGATLTAVEAINVIRERIGMPEVLPLFTTDKEQFRKRIKNERTIELCFEGGHYYWDIRRWKDVAVVNSSVLMGMDIEKVPVSTEYPIGYKHTRSPLPAGRQIAWKDYMYYFPFDEEDYFELKNFILNEYW